MTPISLFLLSLALFGAGAVISLMLTNRNARRISGGIGLVASLVGLGAALLAAGSTAPPTVTLFRMALFGDLTLTLPPLSAFFVGVITVLARRPACIPFPTSKNTKKTQPGDDRLFYELVPGRDDVDRHRHERVLFLCGHEPVVGNVGHFGRDDR